MIRCRVVRMAPIQNTRRFRLYLECGNTVERMRSYVKRCPAAVVCRACSNLRHPPRLPWKRRHAPVGTMR